MYTFVCVAISFWIGWILRDRYICRRIRHACITVLGDDLFLSGNSIDHMKSLMILEQSQIESVYDNVHDDPHTDDTYIPAVVGMYGRYSAMTLLRLIHNANVAVKKQQHIE